MPLEAMIQRSDSQDPEYRPPLTLSPLAIEDLTGEPVYSFTPAGRAETAAASTVPLTGLLKQRLEEFRVACRAREKSFGKELLKAMEETKNPSR